VTLHTDGSVSVEDDGRGIPVGLHPEEHAPVVELVFTRLHAGGKFDKKSAGAYAFSGGLHGVGVSVTNALSTRLEVLVWRGGAAHELIFADGAVHTPLRELESVGRKKTGTRVRVWPDPQYVDTAVLPVSDLIHALRSEAVLLSGIKVSLTIEKTGETREWHYQDGLRGYLDESLGDTEKII